MKLKLGKMTTQEIADWFNISKKTFTNSAQKYLDILKSYADFKRVYGGVDISVIRFDTYVKGYNQYDDGYFNKEIERCVKEQKGLASISGIANRAKRDVPEYKDYRPLTEEEYKIFISITGDYHKKNPEKVLEKSKLEMQLKDREIDIEEYFSLIDVCELDLFPQIILEFEARTGFKIVLATEYQIKAY